MLSSRPQAACHETAGGVAWPSPVARSGAQIAEVTGAEFGDGYQRLIADGSFVMDSVAAARGVAALRQAAPERAVDRAIAVMDENRVVGRQDGAAAVAEHGPHAFIGKHLDDDLGA